ncbi:Hypothetical protein SMAX5B_015585 [Scophthalmus maximus]|uniref:Uncharacterized protein n=1 Tax=Scophthalmus maximus TaxID=52904 RepID=A0A2U9CZ43_SCOMX|nr:Hypothetical protein SMAX5B_015585 [Scophthalmus maximus]
MEKYDEEEKLIVRVEAGERGHIVLWKRNTAQISAEADSPLTGIRGATGEGSSIIAIEDIFSLRLDSMRKVEFVWPLACLISESSIPNSRRENEKESTVADF